MTIEHGDQHKSEFPATLRKPAQRALAAAGYVRLEQFTTITETEILRLHGMGPKALRQLQDALAATGLFVRGPETYIAEAHDGALVADANRSVRGKEHVCAETSSRSSTSSRRQPRTRSKRQHCNSCARSVALTHHRTLMKRHSGWRSTRSVPPPARCSVRLKRMRHRKIAKTELLKRGHAQPSVSQQKGTQDEYACSTN